MKRICIAFVLITGLTLLNWSCEKDNRSYALDVVITVNDSTRVANALVHISAPVDAGTKPLIDYYLYTNEEGVVSIELDNKAVVEIVATKPPRKACGFAELDRGVTTTFIDLKPFNDENNGCRNDQ